MKRLIAYTENNKWRIFDISGNEKNPVMYVEIKTMLKNLRKDYANI